MYEGTFRLRSIQMLGWMEVEFLQTISVKKLKNMHSFKHIFMSFVQQT